MDFTSSSLFTPDFAYENGLDFSNLFTPSTFIPFEEPNPCNAISHVENNDGKHIISEITKGVEERENKRAKHREIEKHRRQEVTSLFGKLRYMLPSHYIKGKRSSSDHVLEAVNYIIGLQKKIKEMREKRDRIKRDITHPTSTRECFIRLLSPSPSLSSNCSCVGDKHIDVKVRTCLVGIEIVASCCFRNEYCLSRVLQLLDQEQCLNVVSCISTRLDQRFMHTIVSEVEEEKEVDFSELQEKIIRACLSMSLKDERDREWWASATTQQSKSMSASSVPPPLILVHRPPSLTFTADILSRNFRILTIPSSSDDPLPIFLSRHASSIRAFVNIARLPVTGELLSYLPSLQIIVNTSVGVDHIDLAECKRRGIVVTNGGDAYSEDVADTAVSLLISVLRRIPAADRFVRSGSWVESGDFPLGIKVSGKRVGIVGLGSIGSLIAKRLKPFSCIISYHSRSHKADTPYRFYPDILSLAAENDVLVLCCSLTDQTRHVVNREVMESLGKAGVIINVGRGGLIDEKEMVKCLVQGVIGGAGLDVFENEPEVPEELLGLDNVVLSPHAAVLTAGSLNNAAELALANLKAFFSNRPLVSPVQLDLIDRQV
ncbi:hypothetical protein AALP_AA1G136200 [Arabis alpina]|uniref:BHLH domain-containing protein n=1 Tax=Arabis alpina TaxID=50452 RepID=A0A087HN19_ARAAL|nr:hypothetical protein AALP_AA1G136200 [Arabis alpina]